MTIGLIGEAVEALARLRARSGLKKVDILNRGVVLYDFFDSELRAGKEIVLRAPDGSEERVKVVFV